MKKGLGIKQTINFKNVIPPAIRCRRDRYTRLKFRERLEAD